MKAIINVKFLDFYTLSVSSPQSLTLTPLLLNNSNLFLVVRYKYRRQHRNCAWKKAESSLSENGICAVVCCRLN